MRKRLIMLCALLMVFVMVSAGMTMSWFTDDANGGEAVYTAGTVNIAAGQTCMEECIFEECQYATLFPMRVIGSEQGLRKDGTAVLPGRSDPDAVLFPDGEFFSLGFGGSVEVEFDYGVCSGQAIVVETTYGDYHLEEAEVYVSKTGEEDSWVLIGVVDNDGNNTIRYDDLHYDLRLEANCARYIKLVDITAPDQTDPTVPDNADGFDVNAIILDGCICGDANWNPGDCSPRIFRVCNKGTKDVVIRARITKEWYMFNEDTGLWEPWCGPMGDEAALLECIDTCDDFDPYDGCCFNSDDWIYDDGFYYYVGNQFMQGPGVIPGTFIAPGVLRHPPHCLEFCIPVYFNHEVGNEYQGKKFILGVEFEAVQASNCAPEDLWGVPYFMEY